MDSIVPSDIPLGKHYTYTLAYPDGKVFYVGKGQGKRIHEHELEARTEKTHNNYKVRVIRKIWKEGGQVKKTILAYFATHDEASLYEVALIFFLPDLTNLTRGGDGLVGLPRTAEHQRKIADARRGKPATLEARYNLSEAHKKSVRNKEHLKKVNEAKKGKPSWRKGKKGGIPWNKGVPSPQRGIPRSAETRRKISEANKGRKYSEERIRKSADARRGKPISKPRSEEYRRKMSASLTGRKHPHSDEWSRKVSEAMRGHKHSEEARRKMSEAQKGKPRWTEEDRQKMSESRKGKVQSEETRHKRSETMKRILAEKRARTAHTLHKEDWHQGHLWS